MRATVGKQVSHIFLELGVLESIRQVGKKRESRWAEKKAMVFRSETWPPNQLPRASRTYWPRKKELILIAQQGTHLPRRQASMSFGFWWGLQVFLSFI